MSWPARVFLPLLVAAALVIAGCSGRAPTPPAESGLDPVSPSALNDPLFHLQWNLQMVRAPEAWAYATGRNVTIAFIDTGIDLEHPDLREKLVLVEGAAIFGDTLQDGVGHGTGVAGIAAASTNNAIGIAGVAPDAMIMPIRAFDGAADVADPDFYDRIAAAIRLATDQGAHVISMSFGINEGGPAMNVQAPQIDEAVEYAWAKGVVLVAAAGNRQAPLCVDPAAHERALCVGNVGRTRERAWDSNFDVDTDFVVAPAGEFTINCETLTLTTQPPNAPGEQCAFENDGAWYARNAGTSYATPVVAGISALLIEQGLTNEQVVARIKQTADPNWPHGDGFMGGAVSDMVLQPNPVYGHGVVNAYCAVTDDQGNGCD